MQLPLAGVPPALRAVRQSRLRAVLDFRLRPQSADSPARVQRRDCPPRSVLAPSRFPDAEPLVPMRRVPLLPVQSGCVPFQPASADALPAGVRSPPAARHRRPVVRRAELLADESQPAAERLAILLPHSQETAYAEYAPQRYWQSAFVSALVRLLLPQGEIATPPRVRYFHVPELTRVPTLRLRHWPAHWRLVPAGLARNRAQSVHDAHSPEYR